MQERDLVPDIPDYFWRVSYDKAHDPDSPILKSIEYGANCQNFAYALLRHFGRHIPHLRSSNLWEDTEHTAQVTVHQPLDLLLFNRTTDSWGAHVTVHVGHGRAIHLCRRIGIPVVWPIAQFFTYPEYQVLVGAKRARATPVQP